MLFQLSQENYPNATRMSVIPEGYDNIALPGHLVDVTIDDCCTLIHQTVQEKGYSLWVNNFFIRQSLLLHVLPEEQMYSLYYSMENTVKLLIQNEVKTIPAREFRQLELPSGEHFGVFSKGVYRSLHITVDEDNKDILQDQEYAAALLREYYYDMAFQPH